VVSLLLIGAMMMFVQRLLMGVGVGSIIVVLDEREVCEPMTISMNCNLAIHSFLNCLPIVVLFRCCYNGVAIQIYQNKTTALESCCCCCC